MSIRKHENPTEPDIIGTLISSESIEGAEVFAANNRKKLGEIHHLTINRETGQVVYADMSFGGFFGMGQDHHTIPWEKLRYDAKLGGYVTDITKDQLVSAPQFRDMIARDRIWEKDVRQHFNLPNYW